MLSIRYVLEQYLDSIIIFRLIILLSNTLHIKLYDFFTVPRFLGFFVLKSRTTVYILKSSNISHTTFVD